MPTFYEIAVDLIPMGKKKGRPTDYRPEMVEQVEKWSWLGATNDKMAEFLNVTVTTFKMWMNTYPDFAAAVKKGREDADAAVIKSLYRRATGYSCTEIVEDHTKARPVQEGLEVDEEGDLEVNVENKPTIRVTKKEIAPDPISMIFWLKNRRPDEWRDKRHVDANVKGTVIFNFGTDDQNAEIDAETDQEGAPRSDEQENWQDLRISTGEDNASIPG